MPATPGTQIGPYLLEAPLGSGGMGVVFRARDTRLDRLVALKCLPAQLGRDPQALERFRREARAASALNHPNICTIYDVGEATDGAPYLVMELLEGETLQQRLARGPLPSGEVIEFALQVSDALAAALARAIIHRDLKPANLFLTSRGLAKVLDFGLAKILAPAAGDNAAEQPTRADDASALTSPGLAVGTIAYMSPEQALGKEMDARSDIFSLGLMLYEMLAGQTAFPGSTSAAIFDGILNRSPAIPLADSSNCPPGLAPIIATALEKDPALRYQSAAELHGALRRLKRDHESGSASTPAAPPPPPATPRPGRRFWAVGALVVLLAAATAAYFAFHRPAPATMSAKDTVVLADFTNSTGDAMFDGALRQGLEVQLEQSPYLTIVSDQQMMQTSKLMGLPAGAPVRGAAAEQLCQRTSSAAALEGSIAQVGSEYSLILRAVNCTNGDTIASVAQTAANKNSVLQALGALATAMRAKLGESLASMARYNTPIAQVTTPSLAALQTYSKGRQSLVRGDYLDAVSLFQQALAADPNFAMAYASRGTAEEDLGKIPAAIADFTQAYSARDHVSPIERFYIDTHYDEVVTGDLVQAGRDYQIWKQTYPNDFLPYANSCNDELQIGQLAAAIADCRAARQLSPANLLVELNLDSAEISSGQPESIPISAMLRDFPESPLAHRLAFSRALGSPASEATTASLARERAWIAARPDLSGLRRETDEESALAAGQLGTLRALLHASSLAGLSDPNESQYLVLGEAFFGLTDAATRDLEAYPQRHPDEATLSFLALCWGAIHRPDRAAAVAAQIEKQFGRQTTAALIDLPSIRAQIALNHHQPQQAITILAPVEPYEMGVAAAAGPAYLRGLADLDLHQGAAAATEFNKMLSIRFFNTLGNFDLLGLARAQAMAGNLPAARASYQQLLAAWKNADPGLPLVTTARAEAARLGH